jgi:hypothetical protein
MFRKGSVYSQSGARRVGGSAVECLPGRNKALGSILSTMKQSKEIIRSEQRLKTHTCPADL